MNKIFGIGLSRTGTLSLAKGLGQIGFKIVHYPQSEYVMFNLKEHGACDIPVAVYYKKLDRMYPNSKFIYTIRDKDDWLISMEKHFKRHDIRKKSKWHRDIRTAIYGHVDFDKDRLSKKYDEHNKDVNAYFKDREDKFLTINICAGEDVQKMLDFLNMSKEKRLTKFPHEHQRTV